MIITDGDASFFTVTPDTSVLGPFECNVSLGNSDSDENPFDFTVSGQVIEPGVLITESGGSTDVSESGTTDTYEVVLVFAPTANVTIAMGTDSQVDVDKTLLTFTPDKWDEPQRVTVTAVNDYVDEDTEHTGMITHTASSDDDAYDGINVDSVTANITDNDTAGITVELVGPVSNGRLLTGEGAVGIAKGDLAVRLGVAPDTVAVLSVTAQDFPDSCLGAPRAGEFGLTVMTSGVSMLLQGGGNTFEYRTVSLESPSQIRLVQFAGQNWLVPLSATFTVVLDTQPVAGVTIGLSSSDTTEGTVSPTSLTFQPGNWDTPKTVTVTGVNDDLDDGDIAYTIVTATASSTDTKYSGINPANVSVTNQDDDVQSLVVSPLNLVVEEGVTSEFEVKLGAQPTSNVTVNIAKQPGGDPDLNLTGVTTLIFTSDDWKTAKQVPVRAEQDPDAICGTAQFLVSSTGVTNKTVTAREGDDEPQIIDDGDPGFTKSGNWYYFPGGGYEGDLYFAEKGGGEAVASWMFPVAPGQYDVCATWVAHANRATDAPYTVFDGSTELNTVDVNQEVDPNGCGAIGRFTVTGNTLVVQLSNAANEYVIADAIRIQRVPPVKSVIANAGNGVSVKEEGTTSDTYWLVLGKKPTGDVTVTIDPDNQVDLGSGPGKAVSKTFTTSNWDDPQEVTVTAVDDTADEGAHTSTIKHSASGGGYDGVLVSDMTVSIADNDMPFVAIIDDGEPGFTKSGNWHYFEGQGYKGQGDKNDLYFAEKGTRSAVASWTFNVEPGQYDVWATWTPHKNRATNAPYTVFDGSTPLETENVNQEAVPSGLKDDGVDWKKLYRVTVTGNTLKIELSNAANEYVIADGVRIERVGDPVPNTKPTTPSGTSPANGATNVSLTPTLSSSSFSDPDSGDSHKATRWQVSTNSSFTNVVWDYTDTDSSKTSEAVASGKLSSSTKYYWRVMHQDNHNAWNSWSSSRNFTTGSDIDPTQIIDDGASGFTKSGTWHHFVGQGYKNDVHFAEKGSGSAKATWTFTIVPGTYEVATTWTPHNNRATDAPYTLFCGSTPVKLVDLNQELAPNDFSDDGANWENIGTITCNSNTLKVELSNAANEYVIADGVRIKKV